MNPIEYPTLIDSVANGLMKGAGVGGFVIGVVAVISVFLVVVGFCGYGICILLGALQGGQDRRKEGTGDGEFKTVRGNDGRVAGRG